MRYGWYSPYLPGGGEKCNFDGVDPHSTAFHGIAGSESRIQSRQTHTNPLVLPQSLQMDLSLSIFRAVSRV